MAETVTIEWVNEVTIRHEATVDKAEWEAAHSGFDGGDSFLAEMEDESSERDYWVTERNAYIDGEQVL